MPTARSLRRQFSVRCTGEDDPIYPQSRPPVRRTPINPVLGPRHGADARASHPPPSFGADQVTLVGATHTEQCLRAVCCAEQHS